MRNQGLDGLFNADYRYKKAKYADAQELKLVEATIRDLFFITDRLSDKVLRKVGMPRTDLEAALESLAQARLKLYERLKKSGRLEESAHQEEWNPQESEEDLL